MSVATNYDVFLSCSAFDTAVAEIVENVFSQNGLEVFRDAKVQAGENIQDLVWRAMAESSAVILVIPKNGEITSSTVLVEVGAAIAWHKQIFLLSYSDKVGKLPEFLQKFPVFPLERLDDVVKHVKSTLTPLSNDEIEHLISIYQEMGIPTDKLIAMPIAIEEFAQRYRTVFGRNVSGEKLIEQLIRIRKSGKLPRLGSGRKNTK